MRPTGQRSALQDLTNRVSLNGNGNGNGNTTGVHRTPVKNGGSRKPFSLVSAAPDLYAPLTGAAREASRARLYQEILKSRSRLQSPVPQQQPTDTDTDSAVLQPATTRETGVSRTSSTGTAALPAAPSPTTPPAAAAPTTPVSKKHGRPSGSRDKQPRKRRSRRLSDKEEVVSGAESAGEEEEEDYATAVATVAADEENEPGSARVALHAVRPRRSLPTTSAVGSVDEAYTDAHQELAGKRNNPSRVPRKRAEREAGGRLSYSSQG